VGDLLIVEDDVDIVETVSEILSLRDHIVRVAANGEEGLAQLRVRLPDLVLLDVEMPVMGGPAMAYNMFLEDAGREKIPIVLLSGIADLPIVAAKTGTPYFLTKPYSMAELCALVDRALRERIAPDRTALPVT
jgi:DNA-binding response OmpR family regulator